MANGNASQAYAVPFGLDDNVIASFPNKDTKLLNAVKYGQSLWGSTVKLTVQLGAAEQRNYFLKMVTLGETGRIMSQGEFESLKAIWATCPEICPEPIAWGRFAKQDPETYFLLTEFREIGNQPAEPFKLAQSLAKLHSTSVSPTGKFGFHVRSCHALIDQAVDMWDESWCAVFQRHLGHTIDLAKPVLKWPEFEIVASLTLEKVVPRLLLPLQSDGRVLKPSLIHGNCWDGNTAMDARTGEAFVFDVCSFYGHHEYDTGNWRAPRHKLSAKPYIQNYKRIIHPSEPVEEWDARNLLYSLVFNIGNAIYVPASDQRPVIYKDMTALCEQFCPEDLKQRMREFRDESADRSEEPEHAQSEEEEEEEEEDD
ncbi:Protein-ribulosamine 3-kinase, chloroplastic [Paramyrothecium foliicola]|nr:Protein-ribulosamine 3-kinase, chloroplastic [Paramyrothecium foliicola]